MGLVALGAVTGLILVMVRVGIAVTDPGLLLALLLGFATANTFSVWDFGRPRSCSLELSELFAALAFVVAAPGDVALAVTGAALLQPMLRSRVGPLHGVPARNWAVTVFAIADPILRTVAGLAAFLASVDTLGRPIAAMLGVTVLVVVDGAASVTVVHFDTGIAVRTWLARAPALRYALPLGAGAVGVGLGVALRTATHPWVAVVALSAALVIASHAGTRLSRERRRSDLLLQTTRSAVATAAAEDTAAAVGRVVADGLYAQRAAVVEEVPAWAVLSVPLAGHGWLVVGPRALRSQAAYDRLDVELLDHLAELATVVLENSRLLQRLADRERLSTMLVATAAHDLRSPLSIAASAMETLREHEGARPGHARQILDVGLRATDRANRLVHDLLVLERDRDGRTESAVAVPAEVAALVVEGLPEGEAERCRIEVHGESAVAMSPALLERVLDNLVRNALRHAPADEDVTIRVQRATGERVVIAVEDRGPGVPADQRAALLEAGAQGQEGASGGYGLGLHIASEFVRRAGGDLRVSDRADGPGACFRVRLPQAGTPPSS